MNSMRSWIICVFAMSCLNAQTAVDARTQTKSIDFSGASSTTPAKVGTVLPSTCSIGASFFKSNALAGQNLYGCTATNTWTLVGPVTTVFGRNAAVTAQKGDYSLTQLSDVTAKQGTGTVVPMFGSSSVLPNDCAMFDSSGNLASAGGPCGSGGLLPAQTGTSAILLSNGTTASWGNLSTGGSGALDCVSVPGQCDIVPAVVPLKANANVFTGSDDFSASPFLVVPSSAGAAPTANGRIAYDTAARQFKGGSNGATVILGGGGPSSSIGAYSALPAPGTVGNTYYATDGFCDVLRDNGSSWDCIMRGIKVTLPPQTGWSTLGTGVTMAASGTGMTLHVPGNTTSVIGYNTLHAISVTAPYTIIISYIWHGGDGSNSHALCGAAIADGTSGTAHLISSAALMGSPFSFAPNQEWTGTGQTATGTVLTNSLDGLPGSVTFVKISDDGTNRRYSISGNGRDWVQLVSEVNTTFLNGNPAFAGLVCGPGSTSVDTSATLLSFSTTGTP